MKCPHCRNGYTTLSYKITELGNPDKIVSFLYCFCHACKEFSVSKKVIDTTKIQWEQI